MAALLLDALWAVRRAQGKSTNIDRHGCERVVPMKVLVLGLSRTGTSSIRQALRELGYHDVYHASALYNENPPDADMWVEAFKAKFGGEGKPFGREEWDRLLGHCMAVTDAPIVPHFDEDLIRAYPEAKVVLSLRDSPEQWWASFRATLVPFAEDMDRRAGLASWLYWLFLPTLRFDEYHKQVLARGGVSAIENASSAVYTEHAARIKAAVARERGDASDVLEFNVKQGWRPLCAFLGRAIPVDETGVQRAFPRVNDTTDFRRAHRNLRRTMDALVAVNAGLACAAAGAAAWGLRWYLGRAAAV